MMNKRDNEIKQLKKTIDHSKTKFRNLLLLFTDTLNVKLRYEQIIKTLMENEKKGHEQQKTIL